MNRLILILLTVIVVIGAIIVGIIIYTPNSSEEENTILQRVGTEYNVTSDEKNVVENKINILETNSVEERISPNAFITFKQKYKECGHTTSEFVEVPQEFVNLTEAELKEKYPEWNVDKFTDTDIVLSKEVEGSCDEHYIVRDVNGTVTVFHILDDGTEEQYQVTDIATEYLTDTDKIEMQKGIEVNGKQNLNQLIEDYE